MRLIPWTKVPNELAKLMIHDMDAAEIKVTLYVVRQTLGYQRKKAHLSPKTIAAATGLEGPEVMQALDRGVRRGTLWYEESGGSLWCGPNIEEQGKRRQKGKRWYTEGEDEELIKR